MKTSLTMLAASLAIVMPVIAMPAMAAGDVTDADRTFLTKTAQGAAYELSLAQSAADKAKDADVRNYAHTIVSDHETLNTQLRDAAKEKGVDLPTAMTSERRADADRIEGMRGKAFDQAFVRAEKEINRGDIADETRVMSQSSDPAIKSLAEAMKQADEKHAQMGMSLKNAD